MRWDPVDDRRYAYRADAPSGSKIAPMRTVRGANRLAIEALPCFPVVPQARRALAAGFRRLDDMRRDDKWAVRWPIWTAPVDLWVAQSLIRHPDVAKAPQHAERLRRLGVAEVFESRRVEARYRSFAPAVAVLGST
jgi:hypothetical protein